MSIIIGNPLLKAMAEIDKKNTKNKAPPPWKEIYQEIQEGLDLNSFEKSNLQHMVQIRVQQGRKEFLDYIPWLLAQGKTSELGEDFLDGLDRIKEMK
jgi:hypothetical protein